MTTSADQAAALRRLADDLEALGGLEESHAAAVQAYRDDPSEENKTAYQEASEALRAHRQVVRESPVKAVEPGGMTITPAAVEGR